ncbi:MAG: ABC transporter ATP-binding protein [bacterium]
MGEDKQSPAVEIKNLSKHYGHQKAVNGIDLTLNAGEFVSLFGPNGAGKTTLIKIIATILKPSSGSLRIMGKEPRNAPEELRSHLGVISHHSYLYNNLSALENLMLYGKLYGVSRVEERANELLGRVGMEYRRHELARNFSRGMQQRVSIARALIHDPDIILLDEPYSGLDQHASQMLRETLDQLHDGNHTILMITHNLSLGLSQCDRIAIQVRGKLVFDQKSESVTKNEFEDLYFKYVEEGNC